MTEFKDVQVGDALLNPNRVWIVSAVYIEADPAASTVALRYVDDPEKLERGYMKLWDIPARALYRKVHE